MSEINYSSQNANEHTLSNYQKINSSDAEYSLSSIYHQSEINQNGMIINNAIKMIWVGVILLAMGLIISIFYANDFLSLLPGAFVDIFSGTMIYLVNKSSENKQKYFENLTMVEHEERIIELIHESNNSDFREKMISKLIDNHCKN